MELFKKKSKEKKGVRKKENKTREEKGMKKERER
jgi:hypothetical protein